VAAEMLRYYETVGRVVTAANIQWIPVVKNFKEQWKAIMAKKAETEPEVPKVTKTLPIIKWTEAMVDYLHRCIGVRDIALAYVIRPDTTVGAITALHAGSPHSTEHGSVEENSLPVHLMHIPSTVRTINLSITRLRRVYEAPPSPHQSSPSNAPRMSQRMVSTSQPIRWS
jgi:hypothetical protein